MDLGLEATLALSMEAKGSFFKACKALDALGPTQPFPD